MMTTILILGFVQSLFFAVLALTKKHKETADYLLAALFLAMCYQLGVNFILSSDYKYDFPHLLGTAEPLAFVYGPLLFFFIKNYIDGKHLYKKKYLLHFLPFLLDHLYNFYHFYFMTGEQKIQAYMEISAGRPSLEMSISMIARSLSPLIYSIWSIRILVVHRRNLKKLYSFTTEKLTLDWLWHLTWSMFSIGAFALILNLIIVFFDTADWVQLRFIIFAFATVWVFIVGYYSVRKTPFYRSFPIEGLSTLDVDEKTKQPEKYEKTRLKEEEIDGLKSKLLDYLEKEKPYLNQNLTIGELAASLDIQSHHLSQLINDQLGKSFFELINSYRVEEVKQRFFDPGYQNLTLLGIAMECGFNSKASFNRIFKQLTSQTPTEYIKSEKAA